MRFIVTRARASCSSLARSERAAAVAYYTTRMKECSTLNIAVKNNNRRETQIKQEKHPQHHSKSVTNAWKRTLVAIKPAIWQPKPLNTKAAAVLKNRFS